MRVSVKDLLPGTPYEVQFRARYTDGETEWSRAFNFVTDADALAPHTPTGITWQTNGLSFVAAWDEVTTNEDNTPCNDFSHYVIEISGNSLVREFKVADEKFELTFEMNRAYFDLHPDLNFRIRSVDRTGNQSAWSSVLNAVNAAPAQPANFDAVSAPESIVLSWDAVDENDLKEYRVHLSTTDSGFTPDATNLIWSGLSTAFVYQSTAYSTTHYFKLAAVDAFETPSTYAADSASPGSSTGVDTDPPAMPTGLTITPSMADNGEANFLVEWTGVGDSDLAGYTVRYRPTDLSESFVLTNVGNDTTEVLIKNLSVATEFEFQVSAFDFAGNRSAYTSSETGELANAAPSQPSEPTILSGVQGFAIEHDLTKEAGGRLENDVIRLEVWVGVGSPSLQVANLPVEPGSPVVISELIVYPTTLSSIDVYVRAVDREGLAGDYSNPSTWTVGLLTGTYFENASISNAKIQSLEANKITAGTGIVNDLDVLSALTIGTDGAIQNEEYESSGGTEGFFLDNTNLIIKSGTIEAAALRLQNSQNLMPLDYSDFEFIANYYDNAKFIIPASTTLSVVTSNKKYNSQALQVVSSSATSRTLDFAATGVYNVEVDASTPYIVSMWVYQNSGSAKSLGIRISWGNGTTSSSSTTSVPNATWTRISYAATAPSGVSQARVGITYNASYTFLVDGIQVEQQLTGLTTPSQWKPPSATFIDGGVVRTGEIRSNQTVDVNGTLQPYWSINTQGGAQFGNAKVRGTLIVGPEGGTDTDAGQSRVQSANYEQDVSGWIIRSDGYAEFRDLAANSISITALDRPTQNTLISNLFDYMDDDKVWTAFVPPVGNEGPDSTPQEVGSTSGGRVGAGDLVVALPENALGYLAIATGNDSAVTVPTNWTLIYQDATATSNQVKVYYANASDTPGTTWSITGTVTSMSVVIIGYDTEIAATPVNSVTASSLTSPSVSAGSAARIVRFVTSEAVNDQGDASVKYPDNQLSGVQKYTFTGDTTVGGSLVAYSSGAQDISGATGTALWATETGTLNAQKAGTIALVADPLPSSIYSGTVSHNTDYAGAYTSDSVFEIDGTAILIRDAYAGLDSEAIYKVTCKVRQMDDPGTNSELSIGFFGYDIDGDLCNANGDAELNDQFWTIARGVEITALDPIPTDKSGWITYIGYLRGKDLIGSRTAHNSQSDPAKLHLNVTSIRPVIKVVGTSMVQVDSFTIEAIQSSVQALETAGAKSIIRIDNALDADSKVEFINTAQQPGEISSPSDEEYEALILRSPMNGVITSEGYELYERAEIKMSSPARNYLPLSNVIYVNFSSNWYAIDDVSGVKDTSAGFRDAIAFTVNSVTGVDPYGGLLRQDYTYGDTIEEIWPELVGETNMVASCMVKTDFDGEFEFSIGLPTSGVTTTTPDKVVVAGQWKKIVTYINIPAGFLATDQLRLLLGPVGGFVVGQEFTIAEAQLERGFEPTEYKPWSPSTIELSSEVVHAAGGELAVGARIQGINLAPRRGNDPNYQVGKRNIITVGSDPENMIIMFDGNNDSSPGLVGIKAGPIIEDLYAPSLYLFGKKHNNYGRLMLNAGGGAWIENQSKWYHSTLTPNMTNQVKYGRDGGFDVHAYGHIQADGNPPWRQITVDPAWNTDSVGLRWYVNNGWLYIRGRVQWPTIDGSGNWTVPAGGQTLGTVPGISGLPYSPFDYGMSSTSSTGSSGTNNKSVVVRLAATTGELRIYAIDGATAKAWQLINCRFPLNWDTEYVDPSADVTAPSAPTSFNISPRTSGTTKGTYTLKWTNPSASDLRGVKVIYKKGSDPTVTISGGAGIKTMSHNGSLIKVVEGDPSEVMQVVIDGLDVDATHYFRIVAFDETGNHSSSVAAHRYLLKSPVAITPASYSTRRGSGWVSKPGYVIQGNDPGGTRHYGYIFYGSKIADAIRPDGLTRSIVKTEVVASRSETLHGSLTSTTIVGLHAHESLPVTPTLNYSNVSSAGVTRGQVKRLLISSSTYNARIADGTIKGIAFTGTSYQFLDTNENDGGTLYIYTNG